MSKELTPEEKEQFGLGGTSAPKTGSLTPEQIAKNLENQKNIQQAQETPKETASEQLPVEESEPEAQDEILDLDTAEESATAETKPEATVEESTEEESDIIDLDNVLDKAEHTYEIEKDTIAAAPNISLNTTESLEEQLAETEPENPEQEAAEQQAAVNKTEQMQDAAAEDKQHVRTFHKDVSQLKNTGNTAVTSQMLREAHQEEREKKAEIKAGSQIKTLSIFGAVLIVIAVGIIMYATRTKQPSTASLTPTTTVPSLLPADIQIPIDVTNALHFKIKSTLAETIAEQTEFKQLAHFYFGKASHGGGMLLSTGEFFNALDIEVPRTLLDATTDQFMFGTYTLQEPHPFLILPVTSFPKAQEAMAAWEGDMLRDLKDVFAIPTEYTEPEAFNSVFRHDIINNQHVQLLYTPIIETLEETFILETSTEEETIETPTLSDMEIFAQCITDSGATFFGADWCPHCTEQKEMFGELAAALLPYQECSSEENTSQTESCTLEGIEAYPTWEFSDGSRLTGSLPLETLAEETACVLPEEELVETEPNIENEGLLDEGLGNTEITNEEEQTETSDEDMGENETMEETVVEPQPQTLTQTQRVSNGENLTLLYTFINEYTLLIATDPVIIPEIVKRYTNRQIFLR